MSVDDDSRPWHTPDVIRALPETTELRYRAVALQEAYCAGRSEAVDRVREFAAPWMRGPDGEVRTGGLSNVDSLQVIAREHGYRHWGVLIASYERPAEPRFEEAVDCVVEGRAERLRALLGEEPELARARSSRRHRAQLIHYVASNGVEDHKQKVPPNAVEVATILLEAGADPDALAATYDASRSQTPLYLHVSSSHPLEHDLHGPIVEVLCRYGARPNGLDNDGLPLDTAIQFGHTPAVDALLRCGARVDNLVFAAATGRVDRLAAACDGRGLPAPEFCRRRARVWPFPDPSMPPDVQQQLREGLLYAAMHGRIEAVRFLLDRGISPDASPFRNETATLWACYKGHLDIVRSLLDRGADPSVKDERFSADALGWAREGGDQRIVRLLERHSGGDAL